MKKTHLITVLSSFFLLVFLVMNVQAKLFFVSKVATGKIRVITAEKIILTNGNRFVNKVGYSVKAKDRPVVGGYISIRYIIDSENKQICIEYKRGKNTLQATQPPKGQMHDPRDT